MLDGILIGLAVLCVVYFIIIVVYAGISTSFAFIWLFFAALLVFLVYGKWYYARNMERIPRWVPVSVVTTCIAGGGCAGNPLYPGISGSSHAGKGQPGLCDCAGGQGQGTHGQQFPEKASGQGHCLCGGESGTPFWCSPGGKGPGESDSEAQVMYDYLVYNGVSPRQLLMESDSTSTVENIAYSKIVIEQDRMEGQEGNHPHARKNRLVPYAIGTGQAAGNRSSHQ